MKRKFTKNDLMTGDIIEERDGALGVVILELKCVLYQAGGLDELDTFTDDLFVDGLDRSGDIFKVYRDYNGPIGFTKRFDAITVFNRKNGKETKEREDELNDKHGPKKGKFQALVLANDYKRDCQEAYLDPNDKYVVRAGKNEIRETAQMIGDIDMAISEAPSMTVCGQIGIDRTLIPVPGTDQVFFMYNKFMEKWHLQRDERDYDHRDKDPIVVIPEENVNIHSRCLLVRMNDSGDFVDLNEEDYDVAKKYMNNMDS